jgi:hypothetical protein
MDTLQQYMVVQWHATLSQTLRYSIRKS